MQETTCQATDLAMKQASGDDSRLIEFPWQDPFPHLAPFLMTSGPVETPPPRSWTSDMELMHHYDMSASYTLPGSVEFRHIHQVEYTRLAFQDEALMHQLLAVAAFHLAFLNPSQRPAYLTRGLQHQTEAARGISSQLVNLTPEVSHACFVAGVLLGIGSFASLAVFHDDQNGPKPSLKDLVDIFHVIRGMYAVLKSSEDVIHQGRLAPLFEPRQYSRQPTVRLQQLLDNLHELERHFGRCHLHDPRSTHIVERAILDLIACVKHAVEYAPTPYEWRVVTSWPVVLSPEFLTLLANMDEVALAVTARYCILLHEAHSVAWFTSGWGRSVLEDIEATPWSFEVMHMSANQVAFMVDVY
ncbi:uncharacterized protein NECHADRAFT_87525 [Fusarium vanettenii 77-13-4]|uniref:Transcription factor domain-containing protein n=1 Tax=Fusarium vanettenii (strain ATCC MYA-4622 / CBS 123669 / FGSC 9596 / NRRL 45880 / 77-13-4) TaxID=660122 RepID=C7ZEK6_FUSV7|nr:uncharacterized protein NECHADRAFT_87525 [Fusarium vanettenii 77-13-4]EEU37613.1 hypothetical protein NECHADRAFT_87525 [Fusarium vanettenii 77-13-4]